MRPFQNCCAPEATAAADRLWAFLGELREFPQFEFASLLLVKASQGLESISSFPTRHAPGESSRLSSKGAKLLRSVFHKRLSASPRAVFQTVFEMSYFDPKRSLELQVSRERDSESS